MLAQWEEKILRSRLEDLSSGAADLLYKRADVIILVKLYGQQQILAGFSSV